MVGVPDLEHSGGLLVFRPVLHPRVRDNGTKDRSFFGICIKLMQSYLFYHPVMRSTVNRPIKRLMTSVFTEMMSALRQQQPASTFSCDILHSTAECYELQGFRGTIPPVMHAE